MSDYGWPQYIMIAGMLFGMFRDARRANGWREPNIEYKNSFYAFRLTFRPLAWSLLLYWGGFF